MRSPLFARWQKALKSGLLASRRGTPPLPRPPRLSVESLEDRAVPATHTFIGTGNANWSVASNWSNNSPPMVGESNVTVVFSGNTTSSQDINGLVVDELLFSGNGNTINLAQSLTLRGLAGTDTISVANGGHSIVATNAANALIFGGTAATTMRVSGGSGPPILNITATLAGTQGLTKTGAGVLALASVGNTSSTYTGATTITEGEVRLFTDTNDGGFGATSALMVGSSAGTTSALLTLTTSGELNNATPLTINRGGTVLLSTGRTEEIDTTLAFNGGALRIDGGAAFRIQGGGTITATGAANSQVVGLGALDLAVATTFTVADGPTLSDLGVGTRITGGQAITKTGPGTLQLTATSAAGGVASVAVNQGALDVLGNVTNTPVTLSGTGSLGGNGTIGNVTAGAGTTVSPSLNDSPVALTTGNLTFGTSTFRPAINNFGRDRIVTTTGVVDVTGAILAPNVQQSATVGTPIIIIDLPGTANGVVGRFTNAATEGATVTGANGQTFTVSYVGGNGNDVTLTPTTTGPNLTLAVDSPSQAEGNGANNLIFTVTLSAPSTGPVTTQFVTASGTATAGSDFTTSTGTLTFAPGVLTQTITVPILGDTASEPNENFTVVLNSPTGAVFANATGTATLTNDDGTATTQTLSINSPSQAEGNANSALTFTVTLSAPSANTVTVQFATASGTAMAGSDFTAASGTVTFAPGVTTQTITVPILGDTTPEADETFTVTLTGPTGGATIGTATGIATLTNDDGTATTQTLSINSPSQAEGNANSALTFTVTLSAPSANTVTVQFATASGTAMAGSDFTAASGTVTFAPGVTTQTITVPILGDTTAELNETFTVALSNPTGGATIGTATGTATLTDDDTPPAQPPVAPPPAPPAPPAPPPPFFSGAQVVGNTLTLTGSGLAGGQVVFPLPPGSFAFFTDVSSDGQGDVVLFLPGGIFVLNGVSGALLLAFFDTNGDGVSELVRF